MLQNVVQMWTVTSLPHIVIHVPLYPVCILQINICNTEIYSCAPLYKIGSVFEYLLEVFCDIHIFL